jgi:magnesium chelatase family protein
VLSAALHGVDAFAVEVEVHVGGGLPAVLKTVGLAEGAVKESQERVKPAIINSGYQFPNRKITINLAPADMRKDGSAFDLPIALALLGATGRLSSRERLSRYLCIGELALDGRV